MIGANVKGGNKKQKRFAGSKDGYYEIEIKRVPNFVAAYKLSYYINRDYTIIYLYRVQLNV